MPNLWKLVGTLPERGLIGLIRCYQLAISPWFGPCCRFTPSCSHYFAEAVRKHGVWRGSWRGLCRVLRCHPLHRGGYDPP